MAIYRTGQVVVVAGGTAQNLNLGFVPSVFRMKNITLMTDGTGTGVTEAYWDQILLANPVGGVAYTMVGTATAGAVVWTRSTNAASGIVPYQTSDSGLYVPAQVPYNDSTRTPMGASTLLKITAITKAANAQVTSALHSLTTADVGVTAVTFHYCTGMTQMNTLTGVVASIVDVNNFTVNINSLNFSTFTNDGKAQCNVITGAPANTLYSNVSLPTAQANLGQIGLTLGTQFMVNTGNVWSYEAILQSPATGP